MPLSNLPERQWRFAQTMRRGDELGLEGIVSKRRDLPYRSGPWCVQCDAARASRSPRHLAHGGGTCEGVAEAGHPIDGALTVAHAVWHFAGVSLGGRPKKRALTRSLRDLGGSQGMAVQRAFALLARGSTSLPCASGLLRTARARSASVGLLRGKRPMRRREFITLIGGAAVAWPLTARAQQPERMRRLGILLPATADDAEYQTWIAAFLQGLQQSNWTIGRNLRVDTRWAGANVDAIRKHATELVALAPDVILAHGNGPVSALQQATRTVAIVFPVVGDPVGTGLVESLARPGGNATGFAQFEFSLSGKWLELLKQIAPGVTRAAILRDAGLGTGTSQFAAIQAMAPSLRMEVNPINMRDGHEIEQSVEAFARAPNVGLILTASGSAQRHRDLVISLAARHKLPVVYYARFFVAAGGLISYGIDFTDQYRRAAGYVDRILRGEKPADLPVQAPTKYELAINLKTAKALGLTVPQTLLATADEVIE